MTSRTPIELSFLGGASSIGASCTLIRIGEASLLVDGGVRYAGSSALPDLAPLAETAVDAVLVTHAHMDHSGGLPVVSEACRGAPVLATSPTIDLVAILLQDAILLTGYQDEESPGRALLDLARAEGPRQLKLGQATLPVACTFGTYGLSAHADRMQMVSFVEALQARTVVLVHGDESAKQALGRSLRCADVVAARDGQVLGREYARRPAARGKAPLTVPTASDLDVSRARHLLGPAAAPVQAAAVAEAWFGQVVDREVADRFARLLESVGLVRRDDDRRDRLWVLGPQDTHLFPDEAALEEQLKRENPKGRLLEFCMRMRLDPPQTETESQGPFFRANMSLQYEGQTVTSGPQQAASKKTAEQLAAQVLLQLVSHRASATAVVPLADEDLQRLQSANPKGRLLEWCAKRKCAAPRFEQHANPQGYQVRALLDRDAAPPLSSAWHLAPTLKAAEQAAADDILKNLAAEPAAAADAAPARSPEAPPAAATAAMALNELKQVGLLTAYGYEVTDQEGPSHQPVFTIAAWATTPDQKTWRTAPVCAPSKKAAQRTAAENLLDLLAEQGVTRR